MKGMILERGGDVAIVLSRKWLWWLRKVRVLGTMRCCVLFESLCRRRGIRKRKVIYLDRGDHVVIVLGRRVDYWPWVCLWKPRERGREEKYCSEMVECVLLVGEGKKEREGGGGTYQKARFMTRWGEAEVDSWGVKG